MLHSFRIGEQEHLLWLSRAPEGGHNLQMGEARHAVSLVDGLLTLDGVGSRIHVAIDGDNIHVHLDGETRVVVFQDAVTRHATDVAGTAGNLLRSPMPGSVVSLSVTSGQAVSEGETLIVIESMKLETAMRSPRDGIVETVHVASGQAFERDALLITLKEV